MAVGLSLSLGLPSWGFDQSSRVGNMGLGLVIRAFSASLFNRQLAEQIGKVLEGQAAPTSEPNFQLQSRHRPTRGFANSQ
jgi:hypothetical protein